MRWRSSDGVWEISVLPRGQRLRYAISMYGALRDEGWLPSAADAGTFLAGRLAKLDGPPWDQFVET